jgi:hypothetical protein
MPGNYKEKIGAVSNFTGRGKRAIEPENLGVTD